MNLEEYKKGMVRCAQIEPSHLVVFSLFRQHALCFSQQAEIKEIGYDGDDHGDDRSDADDSLHRFVCSEQNGQDVQDGGCRPDAHEDRTDLLAAGAHGAVVEAVGQVDDAGADEVAGQHVREIVDRVADAADQLIIAERGNQNAGGNAGKQHVERVFEGGFIHGGEDNADDVQEESDNQYDAVENNQQPQGDEETFLRAGREIQHAEYGSDQRQDSPDQAEDFSAVNLFDTAVGILNMVTSPFLICLLENILSQPPFTVNRNSPETYKERTAESVDRKGASC